MRSIDFLLTYLLLKTPHFKPKFFFSGPSLKDPLLVDPTHRPQPSLLDPHLRSPEFQPDLRLRGGRSQDPQDPLWLRPYDLMYQKYVVESEARMLAQAEFAI